MPVGTALAPLQTRGTHAALLPESGPGRVPGRHLEGRRGRPEGEQALWCSPNTRSPEQPAGSFVSSSNRNTAPTWNKNTCVQREGPFSQPSFIALMVVPGDGERVASWPSPHPCQPPPAPLMASGGSKMLTSAPEVGFKCFLRKASGLALPGTSFGKCLTFL